MLFDTGAQVVIKERSDSFATSKQKLNRNQDKFCQPNLFYPSGWCTREDDTCSNNTHSLSHHSCQYCCIDDFRFNEKLLAKRRKNTAQNQMYTSPMTEIELGNNDNDFCTQNNNSIRTRNMDIKEWLSAIMQTYIHTGNAHTHTSSVLITMTILTWHSSINTWWLTKTQNQG